MITPPIYVKHELRGGRWAFDGPFSSLGQAENHATRCEYEAKGIQYGFCSLEEKNAILAKQEVEVEEAVEETVPRPRGRPRKITPTLSDETLTES